MARKKKEREVREVKEYRVTVRVKGYLTYYIQDYNEQGAIKQVEGGLVMPERNFGDLEHVGDYSVEVLGIL